MTMGPSRWRWALLLAGALLAPALASAQEAGQPERTGAVAGQPAVRAERFMVVAANPHAAEVGYDVLKRGGSAADAAVAVQLMLNLVEPQSSGIGGGAFMLYFDAGEGALLTYDGREKAPAAATPAYWLKPDGEPMTFWDAVVGGRSVGVPGTLALLAAVHERHGKLPWAELIAPTIALADRGFEISPRLAAAIAEAKEAQLDLLEPARSYFYAADGTPKAAGTLLRNPELAATLRLIAAEGAVPFYEGEIAAAIVQAVRTETNPGLLTRADLAIYAVVERAPVCVPYRRYSVCGMGPPTSGGLTVGQMLGLLGHFDLPGLGPGVDSWHLFAEAAKLAYADRALYVADPDFVRMPTAGLLDPGYLTVRAQLIDIDHAMAKAKAGNPPWQDVMLLAPDEQVEQPGTSHFVIVDAEGDMVSATTTIETGFGSRVMTGGFLLNNELTDFSFRPESDGRPVANRVEGGKRPRSSMSPTIVLEGPDPVLLIGSPGGSRIINYVAKSIVAILDWGLDPQAALALGHVVNRNGATDLEEGTEAAALQAALVARGHEVAIGDLNSGLHAILITPGGPSGAADPRREGVALGD